MMKKVTIFIVILLISLNAGLWAQTVYDTIIPVTRFSYSFGARVAAEFYRLDFYPSSLPLPGFPTYYDTRFESNGYCFFFQAEWRNFILGIVPGFHMKKIQVKREEGLFFSEIGGGDKDVYRVDLQFLYRLALSD